MQEQESAEEMSNGQSLRASFGLPTLRHQLSLFDGQMEIRSKSGEGTDITLIIPIAKTA
jgi:signal transduction histidine kinase